MAMTIYHNPRCSKSRKTLDVLRERGIEPTIVEYLVDVPSAERIVELAGLIGVPVRALLRTGEPDYRDADDLPDPADDVALARWLTAHPRVLQRPIVVDDAAGRAVIGRPPENVRDLLPA
ncbi:MAG: arsenate reductase (glutaredoxin) [Woeseiaceae bacterium]|nr:arsenate reductase (glutaredoxin) [Woeseiaceae bacterium]